MSGRQFDDTDQIIEFSVDGGYIKSDRVRIETLSTMLKVRCPAPKYDRIELTRCSSRSPSPSSTTSP